MKENGVTTTETSPAGNWITITINVKQANALLDADFTTFIDAQTGRIAVRTLAYSLPAYIRDHVELVHPTIS